jgi:hypothetical protein
MTRRQDDRLLYVVAAAALVLAAVVGAHFFRDWTSGRGAGLVPAPKTAPPAALYPPADGVAATRLPRFSPGSKKKPAKVPPPPTGR